MAPVVIHVGTDPLLIHIWTDPLVRAPDSDSWREGAASHETRAERPFRPPVTRAQDPPALPHDPTQDAASTKR